MLLHPPRGDDQRDDGDDGETDDRIPRPCGMPAPDQPVRWIVEVADEDRP